MIKQLEGFCTEIIEGKRSGFLAACSKSVLWVLSLGYGSVISLRNWAYDHGFLKRYVSPVPVVISVGNIVVGGTGKTPVTLKIAEELAKDYSVAVLTRGYRGAIERLKSPVMVSEGTGPLYPASYCGDEAYLMAKRLAGVKVFAGKDRKQAAVLAARMGVEVIVLDDGMQYRPLSRDFEIVVVDATDPLGRKHLLPRGFLREKAKGLGRADLLLLNHATDRPEQLTAKHQLARYTEAPVVMAYPLFRGLVGNEKISSLQGKKVGLFCGIAKPYHFKRLLQVQGAEIVGELCALDHELPDQNGLARFAKQCLKKEAEVLVCTEKDWAKIPEELSLALPVVAVTIDLAIGEGESNWHAWMENVRARLKRDRMLCRT